MSSAFFAAKTTIDNLLQGERTIAAVAALRRCARSLDEGTKKDETLDQYIQGRLDGDASWLDALEAAGQFAAGCPEPVRRDGGWTYVSWWASWYLLSVAAERPADVARIFAGLPKTNPIVLDDLCKAARRMPAGDALPLVRDLATHPPEKVGGGVIWIESANRLCRQLLDTAADESMDLAAPAVELAEALWRPRASEITRRADGSDLEMTRLRLRGLSEANETLLALDPAGHVERLIGWLAGSIAAANAPERDADTPEDAESSDGTEPDEETGAPGEARAAHNPSDGSLWWRPAIEPHEDNDDESYPAILTGLLARTAEAAVRDHGLDPLALLRRLRKAPRTHAFKRLRIHLTRVWAEHFPDLARRTMLSRALFHSEWAEHEYAMLVRERFGLLDAAGRRAWRGMIDPEHRMKDVEEGIRTYQKREPTELDRQNRRLWVRYKRLAIIPPDDLTEEERGIIAEGEKRYGPHTAETSGRGFVVEEMTKPAVISLHATDMEGALSELGALDPGTMAERELVGHQDAFRRFLRAQPGRGTAHAAMLAGRSPDAGIGGVLVHAFLSEATEAAKANEPIDADAVLDLGLGLVKQAAEGAGGRREEGERLGSGWVRGTRDDCLWAVVEFAWALTDPGHANKPAYAHPFDLSRLLDLLEPFALDPSDHRGRDDRRPLLRMIHDEAINTRRGRAVSVLLAVLDRLGQRAGKAGHEETAEDGAVRSRVLGMLERQWDPRDARGLAPLGMRVGLLYHADRSWLERHAATIMRLPPPGETGTDADWAAWNSFICLNPPHAEFLRLFRGSFARAVEHLATITPEETRQGLGEFVPPTELGEHIVVLVARGDLAEDDPIVGAFLGRAPLAVINHAMAVLGRSLHQKTIPDVVVERMAAMWDRFWARARDQRDDGARLGTRFTEWFTSGHVARVRGEGWTLRTLAEVLERARGGFWIDTDFLPELARAGDVALAIRVLGATVKQRALEVLFRQAAEPLKELLRRGLADASTRAAAVACLDRLGRMGLHDLGRLLEEN